MSEIIMSKPNEQEFSFIRGYTDENGTLHTTFTVRPMTGRDEELLAGKKEKNQAKILTELLARTITSIGTLTPGSVGGMNKWSEIIRSLYVGDCDYAMLRVRAVSLGDELQFKNHCPTCGEELSTKATIDELEIIDFKGWERVEGELPDGVIDPNGTLHKEISLKLVTQADREALDTFIRTNKAKANTLLIARNMSFKDKYPVSADTVSGMSLKDRKYVIDLIAENTFGIKSTLTLTCPSCGEEFQAALDTSNFF